MCPSASAAFPALYEVGLGGTDPAAHPKAFRELKASPSSSSPGEGSNPGEYASNSNPASLPGGSWIPLSLPLSLLPVSPSPARWRFPGWARRWGRPLHSGLGGGPGAARFPPRLSKLLISPHLAAVAGPRREAGDIVHRNVFQGRRPAAATASCAANNARTSRARAPATGHPEWRRDVDGRRGRAGCRGTHGTAAWHSRSSCPHPWDAPESRTPSPHPSACWGAGDGVRGQSCQCGTGTCLGHSWPRGPGLARRGGVVRQNTELHFHLNSGNGARGAVTAASAIWCWRGSARPGGRPGGGCFALSRGCPAAEHIKAPGRPQPAGTTQGTAAPGRPGAAGLCCCHGGNGVRPAPQNRSSQPRTPGARAGRQQGHRRSGWTPSRDQDPQTWAAPALAGLGLHPDPLSGCHPQVTPEATQSLHPPMSA